MLQITNIVIPIYPYGSCLIRSFRFTRRRLACPASDGLACPALAVVPASRQCLLHNSIWSFRPARPPTGLLVPPWRWSGSVIPACPESDNLARILLPGSRVANLRLIKENDSNKEYSWSPSARQELHQNYMIEFSLQHPVELHIF